MVRIISALILAVTAVCASAAEPLTLVDNPPDRHIVVPGDTLWGISGKFLKQPWRWPEIWQMNKAEVKNPASDLPRRHHHARHVDRHPTSENRQGGG